MLASTLNRLACPTCRSVFAVRSFRTENNRLLDGFLVCANCVTSTPVSHGFPLFAETQLDRPGLNEPWLHAQADNWFRSGDYESFLREKAARNLRDSYAFFQPFNESSRALLALLEPLKQSLAPGDVILDTWCRTGWSGEWLAALFPEQQVISLWEGNSNVLGYAGFQYWLSDEKRAPNLGVVFAHPDRSLPLQDNTVQLVVGLDSLHRYAQDTFLVECLRVSRDDGVLFYPHIHLSNSEPDPFFERGCLQLSGDDWEYILNQHCETGSRKAYIFAEPELFDSGEHFSINSNTGTQHYNGAALIGPQAWEETTVACSHRPVLTAGDYLIVNALVETNLDEARVAVCRDKPGLEVSELLLRHPVYQQRLEDRLGHGLSEIECEVLFLSRQGKTFGQICQDTGHAGSAVRIAAAGLCDREILFAACVSRSMARLQAYYGYLEMPRQTPDTFPDLWATLPPLYASHPIMLDEEGSAFDFASVDMMVKVAGHWLRSISEQGDRVLVCSENCPELFILIWACWLNGRVVVPVDAQAMPDTVAEIIASTEPVACFSSKPLTTRYYQFDSLADEEQTSVLFSDLLGPYVESALPPDYVGASKDLAAILFTSGSTGKPKGVCLSQGSLTHSAQVLAQHFNWTDAGVLLSLGATHTMSGLRNPAVAALCSGMTILVPAPGMKHPLQIYSLMAQHEVTHLSTVPSLLVSFEKLTKSMSGERRPQSLQQVVSTGYNLPSPTREHIEQFLNVPVLSYYGLTETGGICLADTVGTSAEGNLGFPVGAIAQVRDAAGRVLGPGHTGELCIYSPGRASGYFGENVTSSVRFLDGWVHTGDIAQRANDGSLHYIGRMDDQVKDRRGETLYLQEVEQAANALDSIADCCCAVIAGQRDELDNLILFAVASEAMDESSFPNVAYAQLREVLSARKLPQKLIEVPCIARLTNGKVDRKSMLAQYCHQEKYVQLSQHSNSRQQEKGLSADG